MPKRILILDNDIDLLDVVNEVLCYENFEVHTTSVKDNFITLARKYSPDLVILDYHMAGANSGQIFQQFKADKKLGKVPVIIFSPYISQHASYPALNCDAVIAKPFNLTELLDKVTTLTVQN